MTKLTTKQQRFVNLYNGNATEAAIQAGYSSSSAKVIGHENLTKPYIALAIQNRMGTKDGKKILTREELQAFWTKVINDSKEFMSNKLRASELLGKSQAAFTDNHIVTGVISLQSIVENTARIEESIGRFQ